MRPKLKKAKAALAKRRRVPPIPPGYHSVTPYLAIRGAAKALEFYKRAFRAKEVLRMPMPDGKVAHAEMKIGDSHVMVADEFPDMDFSGPQSRGGTTVWLYVYVPDVDATVKRAVAAGAKPLRPVEDQFYGDRSGSIEDPFGHVWHFATHKEDLKPAELRRRAAEAMKKGRGS